MSWKQVHFCIIHYAVFKIKEDFPRKVLTKFKALFYTIQSFFDFDQFLGEPFQNYNWNKEMLVYSIKHDIQYLN